MLLEFIKRNMKIYFRDKAGVFFSFLSSIIVLLLMIAFLGNMNVENTLYIFENTSDEAHSHAQNIITLWTISGIFITNAFSVSISIIGTMIADEEKHILERFFVSPIKRIKYVLGYIISANIISFITCFVIFIIAQIYYLSVSDGLMLPISNIFPFLITLIINIFCSSAFAFLIASFIHTTNAWGGITVVMGTVIGFLAGIYIPFGGMSNSLQNIIKFIPAFEGCSAIRNLFVQNEVAWFNAPQIYQDNFNIQMGNIVQFGEHTLTILEQNIYIFIAGIIFISISSIILKYKKLGRR